MLRIQVLKFSATGVLNTVIGLLAIYGCMHLGLSDVYANLVGYSVGMLISFTINGKWTFNSHELNRQRVIKFLLVTFIAYSGNLLAMIFARDGLSMKSELAQLVGVFLYAVIGFVGYRSYVFKSN